MYWQQRYLEDTKTFGGTSGLDTIELPNKGLLGGVELRVWGTNADYTDAPDVWLHDRLTKIELIVNGSQVVKSYSGDQLLAMMLYKRTPVIHGDAKNMANGSCQEFFYINLGRFWHDTEYLLDLSKVNDPEIRLTYNFAATSANGWTNGTAMTAAPSRNVICHLLRDAPGAPKGYIKTSELYRFTSGVSKKENMTVPRGPTYSNMYLQSWYKEQGLGLILDKLELNINSDDLIPISLHPTELAMENLRQYGIMGSLDQQLKITGNQRYPFPFEEGEFWGRANPAIDVLINGTDMWANYTSTQYTVISTQAAGTSNVNVILQYKGIWPFSVAAIPYFDPMDPRTWIDTKPLGDLWVRVEETSSASTNLVLKLLGDEVVTSYL